MQEDSREIHREAAVRTPFQGVNPALAVDGRTAWSRRLNEVTAAFTAELGGDEKIGLAHRMLVRRAAALAVELERMESTLSRTKRSDHHALEAYRTSLEHLRRLLAAIGLNVKAAT